MDLTAPETRVLGCLLEKQLATPNVYPLTLNSLLAACNQSSNRDPVTAYPETEVAAAMASLRQKGAARIVYGSGQRAEKFRHVLDDVWGLDDQHRAVLCVLMLRGPQTVGELRTRTERLARFDSLGEVEQVLRLLANREEPLARRLERGPGQKEARWVELFSGEASALDVAARSEEDFAPPPGAHPPEGSIEVASLRAEVASLRGEVGALQEEVAASREAQATLRAEVDELRDVLS
ncbi:MAG: YceH family protein [Acidimicrobiales bacterium]